jgi:hypothetical protein
LSEGGGDTAAAADLTHQNITTLTDKFFGLHRSYDPNLPRELYRYEMYLIGGATILHEATHQFLRTEDVKLDSKSNCCYGRTCCKSLPGNYAAKNADSLALFALDLTIGITVAGQVAGPVIDSLVTAGAPVAASSASSVPITTAAPSAASAAASAASSAVGNGSTS